MPPPLPASDLSRAEYEALRATIRERGTTRVIVAALTFPAWAALVITVVAVAPGALFTLVPLTVIAAGFEVVFAIHVGVERVGRFLQVRYETGDGTPPDWEHTAMRLGQAAAPSAGIDPLFTALFAAATILNLLPLPLADPAGAPRLALTQPAIAIVAIAHVLLLVRLYRARRFAATQRARDLDLLTRASSGSNRLG